MASKRHIGLTIFSVCCALSARIAIYAPKPHVPTEAEERWGVTQSDPDPLGFLRGLRYYIYGIGAVGLLIFSEDYLSEQRKKKEPVSADSTAPQCATKPGLNKPMSSED